MRKLFVKYISTFLFSLAFGQILFGQFDFSNQIALTKSLESMASKEIRAIYNSGKYSNEQSIALANVVLERFVKEGDFKRQFKILKDIGTINESSNRLNSALDYYQRAETIAKNNLSDTALITIYFDLAITHRKNSNYNACRAYYLKIIDSFPKGQDNEYLEYAYHGLGNLYQITGDYEKATDYFLQSVASAERRNNVSGVAMSLQHVAETMLLAKNPDKALVSIEKAYQLGLKTDDHELLGLILKDYGQILSNAGKYDEALEKFNVASTYLNGADAKPYLVKVLMSIAEVYSLKGEYQTSSIYLFKCLNEYESFILNEDLGELYLKIGKYYLSNKENTNGKVALEKGLAICQKNDIKGTQIKIALELSAVEEKNGNVKKALELFKTAKAIEESIFNQEKIAKAAEHQFKFDMDKSEKEIQSLRLRQNSMMIIGLAILLTFIILVFLFWAKMKNKTNKALVKQKEEIENKNRRLEESNTALTEFAYASAHDLKEPLRNIGSFVSLLKRRYGSTFNAEGLEYMEFVSAGVSKMDKLLEDLLAYSTLVVNTNNSEIMSESANIGEVLDEIKTSLHSTIEQKKANLQYGKNLPNLLMSRLHQTQLFQNLISNAMKFVDNKPPLIKIDCKENETDTIISIADNGIGIKQEYSDKVFKLFHRLNRLNPNFEGTGVGLSICKNIVEKYNGKIWFESEEGVGTTFFIKLPKKIA